MAIDLDTIMVLVPATWDAPGAGSIPTTRNKNFVEGRIEAVPADIGELVASGMELPGALFEAEGRYEAGRRVGVRVGIYDTGGGDPLALVKAAVAQVTPDATLSSTNLCGQEAVRTLLRLDDGQGQAVVCDYWGQLRDVPTSFLLLRIWRTGPENADEEELFDNVAGSAVFGAGITWAAPFRWLMRTRYGPPPPSEPHEPGRWRYVGWRLRTVFRTKMLREDDAAMATEIGVRRRDALLMAALVFPWMAITLALWGLGPVLYFGCVAAIGAMTQLRSRGPRAVVRLAGILIPLLILGLAMS